MKVLYFLFEGFDTPNGTNHLSLTTIHTLLDNDIDVYLVTSHSQGLFSDIPESLKNRKGFTFSIIKRNKVEKRNFVQRYKDGILYAYNASREWRKHIEGIDVVLLQSTPTAFFSARLLHKYLKKPVIYNNFDVFPDGPFLFGAITSKFVYIILSLMQNYIYRTCCRIVVISEDMKSTFVKKGLNESKLLIIPNWYDANKIKKIDKSENLFVKKYDIDRNKFIVQYAGNIGYTFNYHAVIEVAKILKNDFNIEFHMIGTGAFEEDFKLAVKNAGLTNICFFPWQDGSIINDVYSACDIEIIPLNKGVIWSSFPSKCTLLMACGKTFLCMCEKNSDFYNTINTEQVGICVDRKDYKSAAEEIRLLSHNLERLKGLEKNSRIYGERKYSSERNAYKYVELLIKIMKG